jgi:hypothetical protein
MINHLDNLLRYLFISQIDEISEDEQVGFRPPDKDWRSDINPNNPAYLNVYLADIRENRKLRTNERTRVMEGGIINEIPAPSRIDCHYLITAWSPANVTPQIEATLDEHTLIYKVITVLMNRQALVPNEIYTTLPPGFQQEIAEAELPMEILPVEGFGKLPEFWGTVEWRWKPMVYLVVTLPVIGETVETGKRVSTRGITYQTTEGQTIAEELLQIGGRVFESNDPQTAIEGAEVRLIEKDKTVMTNTQGQFMFSGLHPGNYTLEISKAGYNSETKGITIPGSSPDAFDVGL